MRIEALLINYLKFLKMIFWPETQFRKKYKDQNEKKLMVRINYFNSCERNKIIEIMEKEFPGFIHLEADNMSTPSTSSSASFVSLAYLI